MNILVTGAAGFIGSSLSERLLADGHHVRGIDSFESYYPQALKENNLKALAGNPAFEFAQANLLDCDLPGMLDGIQIIYHLAATPGVRSSWGEAFGIYVENNVRATERLLHASQEIPLQRFVYASSSSVYGDVKTLPLQEDACPQPFSPYGVTKLAGEHLCNAYHRNFGVPVVSLRFFTVYGPRQRPDMAFCRFIRSAFRGDPVPLYGDGEQTRDFTFIGDIVEGLVRAGQVREAVGQTLNIGGGSRVSVKQCLEIIEQASGNVINLDRRPVSKGDVRDTLADTNRIRSILGFKPQVSIQDGLKAQVEWLRDNLSLYEQLL